MPNVCRGSWTNAVLSESFTAYFQTRGTFRRQLLRLPPFTLARLELAFLDGAPPGPNASALHSSASEWGAVGQRPLLRDLHSCMLRLLEVRKMGFIHVDSKGWRLALAFPHNSWAMYVHVTRMPNVGLTQDAHRWSHTQSWNDIVCSFERRYSSSVNVCGRQACHCSIHDSSSSSSGQRHIKGA